MDKKKFLDNVKSERAQWDALLREVGEARMTEPVMDGRTIKDVIAHVTWYEREMIPVFRDHALVGSDLWNLEQDKRNAAIYELNRDRPLDEVLAEARQVYAELLPILEKVSEEDLQDASRFQDMPADWLPWEMLASNTYEHYVDHAHDIRAWLDRGK